jgi:hypothetical protein
MEANQMDGAESQHSSADPCGLHHRNQNSIYMVAINFF